MFYNVNKTFSFLYNLFIFDVEAFAVYKRIRDMREDRDLKQKDLAEYLKCTQVCYSNYEIGKRDIPTEVLIKLAHFYDTSTDYLLGMTDERIPYPKKK